jgi:hypothetical protein
VSVELVSPGAVSVYLPHKVNQDYLKDSMKRLAQMTNNDYTVKGEE